MYGFKHTTLLTGSLNLPCPLWEENVSQQPSCKDLAFNVCPLRGSWPVLTQSQHQSHTSEEFVLPSRWPVSADTSCCHMSVLRSIYNSPKKTKRSSVQSWSVLSFHFQDVYFFTSYKHWLICTWSDIHCIHKQEQETIFYLLFTSSGLYLDCT